MNTNITFKELIKEMLDPDSDYWRLVIVLQERIVLDLMTLFGVR